MPSQRNAAGRPRAEIDEHVQRPGVYCECFAVANGKVAEQSGVIRHLTGGVAEAQEKLAWLATECGRLLTRVCVETNAIKWKRTEMRMCEAEQRRLQERTQDYKSQAAAIAWGEWIASPEDMPGLDYVHLEAVSLASAL
ncbi:hypothetical protein VUR80DRAFT_6338 [Thermomyces stellatus]